MEGGIEMKLSKVFKAKTYEEAQKLCPKGYRMPEIWELVKLACENHPIIVDTEKGDWIFFWSSTKYKDFGVRGLDRYRGGGWSAGWNVLADSGDGGRVVFVREKLG